MQAKKQPCVACTDATHQPAARHHALRAHSRRKPQETRGKARRQQSREQAAETRGGPRAQPKAQPPAEGAQASWRRPRCFGCTQTSTRTAPAAGGATPRRRAAAPAARGRPSLQTQPTPALGFFGGRGCSSAPGTQGRTPAGRPGAGRVPLQRAHPPPAGPAATGSVAQAEAPSLPRTLAPSGMALCCFSTCTAVGAVGRAWGAGCGHSWTRLAVCCPSASHCHPAGNTARRHPPFCPSRPAPSSLPQHTRTAYHPPPALCACCALCAFQRLPNTQAQLLLTPFCAPLPHHSTPTLPPGPPSPHTHTHSKRAALIVTTPH